MEGAEEYDQVRDQGPRRSFRFQQYQDLVPKSSELTHHRH